MGAIPEGSSTNSRKGSSKKSMMQLVVILAIITTVGLGYMFWYVSPDEVTEMVKVVAITESDCIVETQDGFAINIGPCNAQPGDLITATYDAKIKERAAAMNPTT